MLLGSLGNCSLQKCFEVFSRKRFFVYMGHPELKHVPFQVTGYIRADYCYFGLFNLQFWQTSLLLLIKLLNFLKDLNTSLKRHIIVEDHKVYRFKCRFIAFFTLCETDFKNLFSSVDCLLTVYCQCSFIQYSLLHKLFLNQSVAEELVLGKHNVVNFLDYLLVDGSQI